MMTLPTWLVELVNKIDQSDDFDGRIDNLGVDRLLDLVGCLIDKVEDTQTLLNKALDRVAQSSVELATENARLQDKEAQIDKLRYWSNRVTNAVLDWRKQVTGDVGSGCPIDAVVILSARLRKAESEVSRLSGLLEPILTDNEFQWPESQMVTLNECLELLSSYIADYMPSESVPGDEYFAAWENAARHILQRVFNEIERLKAENRQAKRDIEHKYLTNELVPVELLRAKDTEIKLIKDCLTEIQCRIVTKENELSMADAEIDRLRDQLHRFGVWLFP